MRLFQNNFLTPGYMPARRYRKKSGRPIRRRRVNRRANRARGMFNPQPVFTETFRIPGNDPLAPAYRLASNTGGVMSVKISDMPQLAQYSALYQKYKILKAVFICLPQFNTESSDINAAGYNASLGLGNWGMARIVTAINDSPDAALPASENDVLEDNGCRITSGKPKLVFSCRPVPDTLDANGNRMTFRGKYLNFNSTGTDITHYGIRWWYTLPNPGGNIQEVPYFVYCKLTFQLSDPR